MTLPNDETSHPTRPKESSIPIRSCILLAGGHGTRLRPLTITNPKPLIEFCNQPLLEQLIVQFVEVGVSNFVIACSKRYQTETFDDLNRTAERLGVTIAFSIEDVPLGTAGPIRLAESHLDDDEDFFVLNSDIVSRLPVCDMIEAHRSHPGLATILATHVDEPSRFGVLLTEDCSEIHTGLRRITSFIEKPANFISDLVNAGVYILNRRVLELIPCGQATSIERVVFPEMLNRMLGIYTITLKNYWLDVGNPSDYLKGQRAVLNYMATSGERMHIAQSSRLLSAEDAEKMNIQVHGEVLIDENAEIGEGSTVGPNVVIGPGVKIGVCTRLKNCTIMQGTIVEAGSAVLDGIIAKKCHLEKWCRITNGTVLADDVTVSTEVMLNGTMVLPNKVICDDHLTPGEVLM